MDPLDVVFLLNNNLISFTGSARRHRIGHAGVLSVLATSPLVELTANGDHRVRVLAVGPDWTGCRLEVVAAIEQGRVVVIHAMDTRLKLIRLYTERISDGAP